MTELFDKAAQELGPGTSQFKVLVFLAFRNASTPSVISEETGILAGTVRPALRSLLEKGYVKQMEDGTYKSIISFTDIISNLYMTNKK
jgi:DNA-binding MarR family transcriptional regulator